MDLECLTSTQHKVLGGPSSKMATIAPPARPRVKMPTAQTGRKYYTIHSNNNNAFGLKLNEDVRTAIVGFAELDDAVRIGNMIETYFIERKEWPDTQIPGSLILPNGRLEDLVHIFIQKWEFDDIKVNCTRNFLDFISVERIIPNNSAYSLNGNRYTFDAPTDFYRARLAELYEY